MRLHLIRQGEGPAASIIRRHNEAQADREKLERIHAAANANAPDLDSSRRTRIGSTAGGDEQRLRGIPAIGRGVTGAIPGSSPHSIR